MVTRSIIALIASLSGGHAFVVLTSVASTSQKSTLAMRQKPLKAFKFYGEEARQASSASATVDLNRHIPIDLDYPGLKALHRSPDIYLLDDFLTAAECDDLIEQASAKGMGQSPVAYAGWTEDLKVFLRLVPALVLPCMLYALDNGIPKWEVALGGLTLWALLVFALSTLGAAWAEQRGVALQALRTSTSTTLNGESSGDRALVAKTQRLLKSNWRLFEAPTVIRYEPGQALAAHYDANQGDSREEMGEMGQTLATVLVYLNDVSGGGRTRFGLLGSGAVGPGGDPDVLEVCPSKGQALLFFPASASGAFDGRLEHEGRPAVAEKWIARIWRHEGRVKPPYGLPDTYGDGMESY